MFHSVSATQYGLDHSCLGATLDSATVRENRRDDNTLYSTIQLRSVNLRTSLQRTCNQFTVHFPWANVSVPITASASRHKRPESMSCLPVFIYPPTSQIPALLQLKLLWSLSSVLDAEIGSMIRLVQSIISNAEPACLHRTSLVKQSYLVDRTRIPEVVVQTWTHGGESLRNCAKIS